MAENEYAAVKAEDARAGERRQAMFLHIINHRPEAIKNWADSLQIPAWRELGDGPLWKRGWLAWLDQIYVIGRRGEQYNPSLSVIGLYVELLLFVFVGVAFATWSTSGWAADTAWLAILFAIKLVTSGLVVWRLVIVARRPTRDRPGARVRFAVFILVTVFMTVWVFLGPCHVDFFRWQLCNPANWQLAIGTWFAYPILTAVFVVPFVLPLIALMTYNSLAMLLAVGYLLAVAKHLLELVFAAAHIRTIYDMKYVHFNLSFGVWCIANADPRDLREDAAYFTGVAGILRTLLAIYGFAVTVITLLVTGPFEKPANEFLGFVVEQIAQLVERTPALSNGLALIGAFPLVLIFVALAMIVLAPFFGLAYGQVAMLVFGPSLATMLEEQAGRLERDQDKAKELSILASRADGHEVARRHSFTHLLGRRLREVLTWLSGKR